MRAGVQHRNREVVVMYQAKDRHRNREVAVMYQARDQHRNREVAVMYPGKAPSKVSHPVDEVLRHICVATVSSAPLRFKCYSVFLPPMRRGRRGYAELNQHTPSTGRTLNFVRISC